MHACLTKTLVKPRGGLMNNPHKHKHTVRFCLTQIILGNTGVAELYFCKCCSVYTCQSQSTVYANSRQCSFRGCCFLVVSVLMHVCVYICGDKSPVSAFSCNFLCSSAFWQDCMTYSRCCAN